MSIGEPINRFTIPEPPGRFRGYQIGPIDDIVLKLNSFFERQVRPRIVSMLDFDERRLVTIAEAAGFSRVHLELRVDIKPTTPDTWERFARTAGNPLAPTLEEMMMAALSSTERERMRAYLQPLVEAGTGIDRRAFAYLLAVKG